MTKIPIFDRKYTLDDAIPAGVIGYLRLAPSKFFQEPVSLVDVSEILVDCDNVLHYISGSYALFQQVGVMSTAPVHDDIWVAEFN